MGGVVGGSIGGTTLYARGFKPPAAPSHSLIDDSLSAMTAAANGQGLGDLFEYKLKDKITLKKNQSALVPIAQTEIEAEKVSLWNGMSRSGRPLRGLWLKNTSSLTLDGGSFSVLDNEVFAGEGLTDPIKPGERRIVSYATDLGLLVEVTGNSEPQRFQRVKISKGVMTQTSELRERNVYTVKNQDDTARTLIVEHPARPDWKLLAGLANPKSALQALTASASTFPPKRPLPCRSKRATNSTLSTSSRIWTTIKSHSSCVSAPSLPMSPRHCKKSPHKKPSSQNSKTKWKIARTKSTAS